MIYFQEWKVYSELALTAEDCDFEKRASRLVDQGLVSSYFVNFETGNVVIKQDNMRFIIKCEADMQYVEEKFAVQ